MTGSSDKTAKVWNGQNGAEILTLTGHTGSVLSASFSPDGSRIVTGSLDRTAKVWHANTECEALTFKGHSLSVNSASFSPDGSRVVTASDDKTAKVWDAQSGGEILTLKGHTGLVYSASFGMPRVCPANGLFVHLFSNQRVTAMSFQHHRPYRRAVTPRHLRAGSWALNFAQHVHGSELEWSGKGSRVRYRGRRQRRLPRLRARAAGPLAVNCRSTGVTISGPRRSSPSAAIAPTGSSTSAAAPAR